MIRLYGEHTCYSCGKVPSLGWVYSCKSTSSDQLDRTRLTLLDNVGQQDRLLQHQHLVPDSEALPVVPDTGDYFEAQAKVAESIGMSASVVKQMRAGEYSFDQIETLLQQRRHVLDVIRKAEDRSAQNPPLPPPSLAVKPQVPAENIIATAGTTTAPAVQHIGASSLPMTPAGTPANTPAESTTSTPTKKQRSPKKLTCNFQVCHACRPFFQDRLPMGFDSVLNNEVPALSQDEVKTLPVRDAKVVRNLGLRHPPQPLLQDERTKDGIHIAIPQSDGYGDDNTTEDWTPADTTSSEAESDLLEDVDDPYPCPGSGVCPLWSPLDGCAYDNGFDDGQRAAAHGFVLDQEIEQATPGRSYNHLRRVQGSVSGTPGGTSSTGSSISLPEPKTELLTPTTPMEPSFSLALESGLGKTGKAATVCGVMSDDTKHNYGFGKPRIPGKDSSSSLGSEIEVEGGVALTEEAVESGMPDIATAE